MAAAGLTFGTASCTGDAQVREESGPDAKTARLVLEATIGNGVTKTRDYEFGFVIDMLRARDGTLWVLDGMIAQGYVKNALLRQFDSTGQFIRQVGRTGFGPGEYDEPLGLAALPDGRVALRCNRPPGTVIIYSSNGVPDTTWSLGARISWWWGGPRAIHADKAGVVSLPFEDRLPAHDGITRYVRVRMDGSILDTVPAPVLPSLQSIAKVYVSANGATSRFGVDIPYHARWVSAWNPNGKFAVAQTDTYRIELRSVRGTDAMVANMIERPLPSEPVTVTDEELAVRRVRLDKFSAKHGVTIPELPRVKPTINSLVYSDDGQLMVMLHQPSRLKDGSWIEAGVYDVFDIHERYVGRLNTPDSFDRFRLDGDHIMAVVQTAEWAEAIQKYKVVWH